MGGWLSGRFPRSDARGGGDVMGTDIDRRRALGVPPDAERVLVFTETSHWDPNWLLTSEGYFRLRVRRNLRQALDALAADPRRVYSVECVFFLRMFYERVPQRRAQIRQFVNEGRLRMMGSGVTTPDTIIPPAELQIRDYLLGQEWLRRHGMDAEPDVAYFPDTFGFSPGLPDVLGAVGVTGAGLCRVDGMYFLGNETESARHFPRPGSTAHLLSNEERTLDFVWRGPDGAALLCHWLAFTYGQGSMLAHVGLSREVGAPFAVRWRTERHIAAMVAKFVGQLAPLARTPYLLCPIGFDFSTPIPRLLDLLDRYNERQYPTTGTWVVNAGLDDYLALVDAHRDDLPVLEIDPSQYFTGFFTSRPTVKRRYQELVDELLLTERHGAQSAVDADRREVASGLADAWWTAVTANHHDYVTGTAPDGVTNREQLPWLDDALASVRRVAGPDAGYGVATDGPAGDGAAAEPGDGRSGSVTWRRVGERVEVTTPTLLLTFDEARGGALVTATTPDGTALIGEAPSLDVVIYIDSGGLWRMGHEFAGGRFHVVDRMSDHFGELQVTQQADGTLVLKARGTLDDHEVCRSVHVDPDCAALRTRVDVELSSDRTAVLSVVLPYEVADLVTDVPGTVVRRPARDLFEPTYWSVQSVAHLLGPASGDGQAAADNTVAVFLGLPGAVAARLAPDGTSSSRCVLEAVVARNAHRGMAYGFLPLVAQPASGRDPGPHRFDATVAFLGPDDSAHAATDGRSAGGLAVQAQREVRRLRLTAIQQVAAAAADRVLLVECDGERADGGIDDNVRVLALKPADRGPGVIARLQSVAPSARQVRLRWTGVRLTAAARCDGRERDLAPLDPIDDAVPLIVDPGITSVRLVCRDS